MEHMSSKFEMSPIRELAYFFGLQVKQQSNGTFISESKYAKNLTKKFGLETATHRRTPVGTHKSLEMKAVRTSIEHYIEA